MRNSIVITEFEFFKHGVKCHNYFTGTSASEGDFEFVVTGKGESEYSAFQHALITLWDILGDDADLEYLALEAESLSKEKVIPEIEVPEEEMEEALAESQQFYLSIRYNLPKRV